MRATLGGLWPICFLILGLMEGCRCSGGLGPCDQNPPLDGCNQACTTAPDNCPAGLYCDATSNQCTADCSATSSCASNETCTADGRCVASSGDGSTTTDGGGCGRVNLTTTQVIPSVITIIDESGSMRNPLKHSTQACADVGDCKNEFAGFECPDFSGQDYCTPPGWVSRWDALEEALVGVNMATSGGLFDTMQSQVRFGAAFYTGSGGMSCTPSVMVVPDPLANVMLNGYAAIKAVYDTRGPNGSTPTAYAIQTVRESVLSASPPVPVVFILATDGAPNCGSTVDSVVTQIETTLDAGIPTYVIGLGGADSGLNTNLQLFADAGDPEVAAMTKANGYLHTPTNPAALQSALEGIIGAQVSCTMNSNGTIMDPSKGTVTLNGRSISYTPNSGAGSGWTATAGGSTIEILGTDCDELKGTPNSTVNATFPCGAACVVEFC